VPKSQAWYAGSGKDGAMEPVEIRTERLLLRAWRPDDAPAVLAACTDPLVQAWTSGLPSPYTAASARAYVEQQAPAAWAADTAYAFAVTDRQRGAVVANVALRPRTSGGSHDVGYWAAPTGRGRGFTTEALSALCRWGFADVGATRIEWYARVGNWASRRVAEKAGFTIEGTLRAGLPTPTGRSDAWVGARLPGDAEVDTRLLPAYEPLTDGVVRLRPWRLEDADGVRRACDDPMTVKYLPVPSPYTHEDGVFYVSTLVPLHWAEGLAANVAVTDAATGDLLGAVGLKLELRQHGVGEVGYWTAPWARGRGVAGRAAALHAQWGLEALGLNRIELLADVENLASQRAAEKGGFTREGVGRRARPDRTGEARDMVLFALTR
jgi:RimJ/RimL family protein N-acetyltransferase